jgi:hypothetical protein
MELYRAITREQVSILKLQVASCKLQKAKQKGRKRNVHKNKKAKAKTAARVGSSPGFSPVLFRLAGSRVVPQHAGPCVTQYYSDIGECAPSRPLSTIGLAEEALKRKWPLFFGKRKVATIGGVPLYHTHVSAAYSDDLSRLTPHALPYLKAMVLDWGEAQMPQLTHKGKNSKASKTAAEEQKNYPPLESAYLQRDLEVQRNPPLAIPPLLPTAPKGPPPAHLVVAPVHLPVAPVATAPGTIARTMKPIVQKAKLSDYFETEPSVNLEYEQLLMISVYRLVHAEGVANMKNALLESGFSLQHPFVVMRYDDIPDNKGKFVIMDGMHRATAMSEIRTEHGDAMFNKLMVHNKEGKAVFPCLVIRRDTPEYLLTGFACATNDSNDKFTPMSWMDSSLNIAKFAMSWTEYMLQRNSKPGELKSQVWVGQPHTDLYAAHSSATTSWSEFQKKMGFVSWCCLRQDADLLRKEALCYRKGDSPRSMFLMALLMDEMDYEDINKFRVLYKSQLDPEFARYVGEFSKAVFQAFPIWKEASTYPALFTRGEKAKKTDIENDYMNPAATRSASLIMKSYLVIGRWIVNPKMSSAELAVMRQELANYVTYTPDALKTFMTLLAISEPSGTMSDCDVWKCAKKKGTQLQLVQESSEVVSEEMVTLHMTEWPFPNYASRKVNLENEAAQDMSDSQVLAEAKNTITQIPLDDLKLLMGCMIRADICGQCNSPEVRFACAYHRIYLCEACRHLDCTYEIGAGWEISDRFGAQSPQLYAVQTSTIALYQLLSPPILKNPRKDAMYMAMKIWPARLASIN